MACLLALVRVDARRTDRDDHRQQAQSGVGLLRRAGNRGQAPRAMTKFALDQAYPAPAQRAASGTLITPG
jgi:hypothetical protein